MRTVRIIVGYCLISVLVLSAFAQSRSERELQSKLEAKSAALLAAQNANALLLKAIQSNSKAAQGASSERARDAKAAESRSDAAKTTAGNSEDNAVSRSATALEVANTNAEAAQQAVIAARTQVLVTTIIQGGVLLTLAANLLWGGHVAKRDRRWAQLDRETAAKRAEESAIHAAATSASVEGLRKNTDGLTDALVRITGSAKYAEGLKAGQEKL
jgi:hypothetical protein